MENFQDAVAAIVNSLPEWKHLASTKDDKFNEAQTSQAVILRLLAAAGYDIWNPFEVLPQYNQDRSIPDFIIVVMGINKFVVEVKALDTALIRISRVQATSYASKKKRLRWSILTNGKQWEFLDDDMKHEDAGDRIALVLNLLEPREGEFLGILLDRQLWEAEGANERVAEKVQLIRIAMEVSKILHSKKGIKHNQEGVEIAIDYLPPTEDKDVAKKNLPQIVELLFPQKMPLVEIQAAPTTQITSQATEEPLNVWQVLSINLRKLKSSSSRKYTIMFEGDTMNFAAIPDIMEAVAETCLTCKTEQSLVFVAETYEYSKRLLSNHRYIPVNKSFNSAVNKVVKKQLESLGLPEGCITISSNKTSYTVP